MLIDGVEQRSLLIRCMGSLAAVSLALASCVPSAVIATADAGTIEERDSGARDLGTLDRASTDRPDDDLVTMQRDTGTTVDAAEPDAAEPDAAEPDAAEPDAVEPDAAEPDASSSVAPFLVFVDPAGDDASDGSTPAQSVLTLSRVQDLLEAAAPEQDVEVRIAQGVYTGQSVVWTYYHPSRSISFMPIDYHGGGVDSIAGRPVFDGQGAGALLTLDVADGRSTNLEFIYLQLQGYRTFGLLFRGDRDDFDQGWNGGNRVYGCLLTNIGNLANPGDPGYGGLDLVNSRDNAIRNNHFVNVENASGSAGLMHAIYLAHGSSDNDIRSNRFVGISGDPIRVRDGSDRNQIIDNVFENTGSVAFISDWWCDMDANPACTKPSGECPSWENAFRDNETRCGYDGSNIALFTYFQGVDYVPGWCVDHATSDGWARLRTSGNSRACP